MGTAYTSPDRARAIATGAHHYAIPSAPWYEHGISFWSEVLRLAPADPPTSLPTEWHAIAHDLADGPPLGESIGAFPITRAMARALSSLDETQTMVLLLLAQGETLSDVAGVLDMSVQQVRSTRYQAHRHLLGPLDEVWPRFEAWLGESCIHRMGVVRFTEEPVSLGRLGSLEPELAMRAFVDLAANRHHSLKLVPLSGSRFLLLGTRRDTRMRVEGLLRERAVLLPISDVGRVTEHDPFVLTHATEAFEGVRRTRDGRLHSAHLSRAQIAGLLVQELAARGHLRWSSRDLMSLMRRFAPERIGNWSLAALERALVRLGPGVVRPLGSPGHWSCVAPPHATPSKPVATMPVTRSPSARLDVPETGPPRTMAQSAGRTERLERRQGERSDGDGFRTADSSLADEIRRHLLKRTTPVTYIELARELATTPRDVRHVFQSTLIPCGAVTTEDGRRWRLTAGSSGRPREDDDMASAPNMTKRDEGR